MKPSLLNYLECPTCHAEYQLVTQERDQEEVMEGELQCQCGSFPIHRGVPRLLPSDRNQKNWETATRFGEQWNQFTELCDEYRDQFLSWIEPVKREDFQDKVVLDAGCGKGRHVFYAQQFGAKEVIGIDLSHAVEAAFQNVGRKPGVHILQADIFALPFKPVFDLMYSIGVLHHTPDPQRSFQCMVNVLRPGGKISVWVYGREGNGWIIYLINPLRKLTSWLPIFITKAIAFCLASILYVALRWIYRPVSKSPGLSWLQRWLPYEPYLTSISHFPFREIFLIVFDHLIPGIAYYIRREEFTSWFQKAGLKDVLVTQRFGNSWRGFGIK